MKNNAECIFCGRSPCECNGPPKSKPAQRKLNTTKSDRPSAKATPFKQGRQGLSNDMTEEDLDYRSSVRALAPILSYEDRESLSSIINAKPSPQERLFAWRKMQKEETRRRDEGKRTP